MGVDDNGWTDERRKKQAEAIRRWSPWTRSTGPKSVTGKARVSRNADCGGQRQRWRAISPVVTLCLRQRRGANGEWSELLLPVIDRLEQLMRQKASPSVALAAVIAILDLNGLIPARKMK